MGTRSTIGIENPDGTIEAIYCHWDGYLSGVGATLLAHYTDEPKIRELLALGSLSSLGRGIGTQHSFEGPQNPAECTAYHRDRGEDLQAAVRYQSRDDWRADGEEYNYLFVPGTGWLVHRHDALVDLAGAIARGDE